LIAADVAPTLNAHFGDKQGLEDQHINGGGGMFVAHALRAEGFDASEDGTGRGTPIVPVAFDMAQITSKANRTRVEAGLPASTLNAAGQMHVVQPIAIQERAVSENPNAGPDGAGIRTDGAAYTLEARTVPQAVAFTCSEQANGFAWERDVYGSLTAQIPNDSSNIQQGVRIGWRVRRLTPTECERLQGFPDGYTNIPYRNKNDAPDGPRYKALGNSMAVNAMRWIGRRIEMVDAMETTHV
jgi:DNA (cytosine-5)-methyltransferase 1